MEQQHAGVPLRSVRAGEVRCEKFLYELMAGPAGGLRPPSGPATTRRSPWSRPHPQSKASQSYHVVADAGRVLIARSARHADYKDKPRPTLDVPACAAGLLSLRPPADPLAAELEDRLALDDLRWAPRHLGSVLPDPIPCPPVGLLGPGPVLKHAHAEATIGGPDQAIRHEPGHPRINCSTSSVRRANSSISWALPL
jgi:hypothetical protein